MANISQGNKSVPKDFSKNFFYEVSDTLAPSASGDGRMIKLLSDFLDSDTQSVLESADGVDAIVTA